MAPVSEKLASVIVPIAEPTPSLSDCLERVRTQDYEKTELIVVCGPGAARQQGLPEGSQNVRVIREKTNPWLVALVNIGMRAARGHVKVLLMPRCVPANERWLRSMLAPFNREDVGVTVASSSCPQPALAEILAESAAPLCAARTGAHALVSQRCDAYRASLLADIGYFSEELPPPGEAVDMSLRVADAGYAILGVEAEVECRPDGRRQRLTGALAEALDYGRADAVLQKTYDLHWLNGGVFAGALASLALVPISAFSLPIAWLAAFLIFAWGWVLSIRLPAVGWHMPLAPLNLAAYALIVLSIRDTWWPTLFGWQAHPAIIRQWCWLAAVLSSYLLLLTADAFRGALRATRHMAPTAALRVLAVGPLWRLAAGAGFVAGSLLGGPQHR